MSSIYDKKENLERLDGGKSVLPNLVSPVLNSTAIPQNLLEEQPLCPMPEEDQPLDSIPHALHVYQEQSLNALQMVDDVVLKNYLAVLSKMNVIPAEKSELSTENVVLFKINKMVYEKDEYATDKFISVVSAMTYTESSLFLIVDGHVDHTDFYLGIKCNDPERQQNTVADTFKDSLLGQFPGADFVNYSIIDIDCKYPKQDSIFAKIEDACSISSCVGVPSYKNSKGEYTNATFIQGIEKFATAMQGKEYTAIILASNVPHNEIAGIRGGYENLYTQLSAMSSQQLSYSTNESLANAISRTSGVSDAHGVSTSIATSDGTSHTSTLGGTISHSDSHAEGESKENWMGKVGKSLAIVGGAVASVAVVAATGGAALPAVVAAGVAAAGGAGAVGVAGGAVAAAGGLVGLGAKTKNKTDTKTITKSESHTTSDGVTHTETETITVNDTHTDSFSESDGTTSTVGTSKNFTISIQNKHILEIQKKIEKQLERVELCESTGLWSTGAYFLSYGTNRATAEIGATIFRSLMQGDQSGVETSAINTWYPESQQKFTGILDYLSSLSHPVFEYDSPLGVKIEVLPTSLLSSKELAILIGLPRKSVPGFPVVEHISMGKEVVRLNNRSGNDFFRLGCIYDQGKEMEKNQVRLDVKSLTQHTFITGSTGCGKSNTIYHLIKQIRSQSNAKFLVIEPAKGEYKDVFGNENIYGTNPQITPLLKINPFKFPEGIHVLEHIDRLIEVFNVCWPMYAAMPAVLKEAVLNSYEHCGWDLYTSKNKYSNQLFPSFADLLYELNLVVDSSSYSDEVKSNYKGSLITRVRSLNNGFCKQIFTRDELGDVSLFDENVIIDLSRIGSQETKSLIMGLLILRLNEYRVSSHITPNSDLKHVTILEEAHCILKSCSQGQNPEESNIMGKSVELISNSIAEMRTYGEGFIIVDQSPGTVDISAIRNTNTKVIMRLPEDSDRRIAGKASGMKDNQIDEIAKLPTGVAVVYQNDWEEPVLCKIDEYDGDFVPFKMNENESHLCEHNDKRFYVKVLDFLLSGRINKVPNINVERLREMIDSTDFATSSKIQLYSAIDEYREQNRISLWDNENFLHLSVLVTAILNIKTEVVKVVRTNKDWAELTRSLTELVKSRVPGLPDYYTKTVLQCLLKDYSTGGTTHTSIYETWRQFILNKGDASHV